MTQRWAVRDGGAGYIQSPKVSGDRGVIPGDDWESSRFYDMKLE